MNNTKTKGLFTEDDLELAWERVCASVGSDVKDYFGINVFNSDLNKHLGDIYDELESNQYSPVKPFKYFEPKKCGTQRTKTVLNIKDAIIYQAIANKIGASTYIELERNHNFVFGSVLNESVYKGVAILEEDEPDFYFFEYYVNLYNRFIEGIGNAISEEGVQYKLETDITGFFDCIPHSVLLLKLLKYGIDKELLELLSVCLNTWSGTRDGVTLNVGIPQGPPASFLLANILLDELDDLILDHGVKYYRFMDDIRIYSDSREELLDILVEIDRYLKRHSLSLNASKTEIKVVESELEFEEHILEGSGIPFDESLLDNPYNSDISEEREELIAAQQQEQLEQLAKEEIILQDETQLKINKSYTSSTKFSHLLLNDIESKLLEYHEHCREWEPDDFLLNENIREFLTLAQRWRSLVSSIQSIEDYEPNLSLVNVWLFGIEKFFWKTNSMVWNLNLYSTLNEYASDYEKLLNKYTRFEWVKYQLLNLFYKVYPDNVDKHISSIESLTQEKSPLIRLGYYSVLIGTIRENTKLFGLYSSALKSESDEYVKESILSSVYYKNTQVSIKRLREWFLK